MLQRIINLSISIKIAGFLETTFGLYWRDKMDYYGGSGITAIGCGGLGFPLILI
jgi:hypothetical protein